MVAKILLMEWARFPLSDYQAPVKKILALRVTGVLVRGRLELGAFQPIPMRRFLGLLCFVAEYFGCTLPSLLSWLCNARVALKVALADML